MPSHFVDKLQHAVTSIIFPERHARSPVVSDRPGGRCLSNQDRRPDRYAKDALVLAGILMDVRRFLLRSGFCISA